MSTKGRMSLSLNPLSLSSNSTTQPSSSSSNNTSNNNPNNSYYNESNIHQDIKITFTLPNGNKIEETVKNGETVQEIKRRMYAASKIPSNAMFYFNGRMMMDPLSLNDIPGVDGLSSLIIDVKVKEATTPQIPIASDSGTSGTDPGSGNHKDDSSSTSSSTTSTLSTSQQHSTSTTNEEKQNIGNGRDEKGNCTPPLTTTATTTNTTPTTTPEQPPRNKIILPKIPALNLVENPSPPPQPRIPALNLVDSASTPPPSQPKIPTLNLVENAPPPAQTHAQPATLLNLVENSPPPSKSTQDPLPSLPHAAFDDNEPMPPPVEKKNSNGKKEHSAGESSDAAVGEPTTIEVNDDNAQQIETLGNGGGRKWKFCFLV